MYSISAKETKCASATKTENCLPHLYVCKVCYSQQHIRVPTQLSRHREEGHPEKREGRSMGGGRNREGGMCTTKVTGNGEKEPGKKKPEVDSPC